jgi:GDPmannose 4,6-dehydratase
MDRDLKPTVLITGSKGQDGYYTAKLLDLLGVKYVPLSYVNKNSIAMRDEGKRQTTSYDLNDILDILEKEEVTHIIHLAGMTMVSSSWDQVSEVAITNTKIISVLLDAMVKLGGNITLVNACSSEIFASSSEPLTELSQIGPTNPYGASKVFGYYLTKQFRDNYSLAVRSAILFPHESSMRRNGFLFAKLLGLMTGRYKDCNLPIEFGSFTVTRDWGFALEYCAIMLILLFEYDPIDLCIATGFSYSIYDLIQYACEIGNVPLSRVKLSKSLYRHYEPPIIRGSSALLNSVIGCKPIIYGCKILDIMYDEHQSKREYSIEKWLISSHVGQKLQDVVAW